MEDPMQIATEFGRTYEHAWSSGSLDELMRLYDEDAILVGYKFAHGRDEIKALLGSIIAQGFSGVRIRVIEARRDGDIVLVAIEYSAFGTTVAETPAAKSSQVLTLRGQNWVTLMHTAP